MMTISESEYSSKNMSSIFRVDDRVVHRDNYNDVQQSSTVNSALVTKRGFKPSDMFDPQKKEFLTNLSYKLFPVSWEDLENKPSIIIGEKEVDLNKIFTPAPDADEHIIKKNKKTFASSAFYVPGIHPTVKEQMELARAISRSLSDSSNQLSKGQSMYVNRKKRSVKWVHEGKGRNTSNVCATPTPSVNHDTPYRPPSSTGYKQPITNNHTKYNTYPKSALKNSSNLPKLEPFPIVATTPTSLPDYRVPVAPTKLNNIYAAPKSSKNMSLWNGNNYNVAPRGWGEVQDYYRPVICDQVSNGFNLPYSDF